MENSFELKINYSADGNNDQCPLIMITDHQSFDYSLIARMYQDGRHGHGIQVTHPEHEKILMKMCDAISEILMNTKEELKNV